MFVTENLVLCEKSMPKVTFISESGIEMVVDADSGTSLMNTAIDNDIDGIYAECGGGCACATCHCYIDEKWMAVVGEPDDMEDSALEMTNSPRKSMSRLSCQIDLTDEMDGLIVHLPENQ